MHGPLNVKYVLLSQSPYTSDRIPAYIMFLKEKNNYNKMSFIILKYGIFRK